LNLYSKENSRLRTSVQCYIERCCNEGLEIRIGYETYHVLDDGSSPESPDNTFERRYLIALEDEGRRIVYKKGSKLVLNCNEQFMQETNTQEDGLSLHYSFSINRCSHNCMHVNATFQVKETDVLDTEDTLNCNDIYWLEI